MDEFISFPSISVRFQCAIAPERGAEDLFLFQVLFDSATLSAQQF